jgi:hypothetical protein
MRKNKIKTQMIGQERCHAEGRKNMKQNPGGASYGQKLIERLGC